ncbi:MAG: biotin/lipoyl-containing protein [Tessaracoccus sp.]
MLGAVYTFAHDPVIGCQQQVKRRSQLHYVYRSRSAGTRRIRHRRNHLSLAKEVGDTVEVDEPLLEVSTDKVDTEIPSPVAGVLLEIRFGRRRRRRSRRRARHRRR